MHRSGLAPGRRLAHGTATAVVATLIAILSGCGSGSAATAPSSSTAPTAAPSRLQGRVVQPPAPKPAFTLTDTAGKRYDFAARTAGQLTYLYFGYTNCPDICQIRMSQLAAVTARPDMPEATVVFVTTDPERDTTAVLRKWLAHFDAAFIGLTGTPAQVAAAQEAAGVPVSTKQPGSEPGTYLMNHPSSMLSYAPDGKGYTEYPYGTKIQAYVDDAHLLITRTG